MKTGATLFGVAAILAVLGYFGMQAFDRYEQRYAMRSNVELLAEALKRRDLSPNFHPGMSRVALLSEPTRLGGATGRGAKPASERSVPSRCIPWTLLLV